MMAERNMVADRDVIWNVDKIPVDVQVCASLTMTLRKLMDAIALIK